MQIIWLIKVLNLKTNINLQKLLIIYIEFQYFSLRVAGRQASRLIR